MDIAHLESLIEADKKQEISDLLTKQPQLASQKNKPRDIPCIIGMLLQKTWNCFINCKFCGKPYHI